MADRELLEEVTEALGEAVENERSMRIGHDVARVLHAALLDRQDEGPHQHVWHALGWDRPGGGKALVIQSCSCGLARELEAGREASS